jgi:PAS domain S-box-containing protein
LVKIHERDSTRFIGGFGELSRDMLAALLDQSEDCVKILDLDGHVDFMNRNGRCIMEIDDFCVIAGSPWDALWPEETRETVRAAVASARSGEATRFEAFCPTAKGTPKWWEVTISPVRDEAGEAFALLSISRDVTERRRTMERLETMAHEMRHRLRNAFAVSGAIALASGRDEPEHHLFAETLASRYNSLAMAQSRLLDQDSDQNLRDLAAIITEAFDFGRGLVSTGNLPEHKLDDQQHQAWCAPRRASGRNDRCGEERGSRDRLARNSGA